MPVFFFDTGTGPAISVDDVGVTFPSFVEARVGAQRLLTDIARESLLDGGERVFTVIMRQGEQVVFQATLTMRCVQLVQDLPEPPAVAVLESIPTRAGTLLHECGLGGALAETEERMRELRIAGDLSGATLWARIAVEVLNAARGVR